MYLKYYAISSNLPESLKIYADIFNAKLDKNPGKTGHASMFLFGNKKLHLLVWGNREFTGRTGTVILKFEDNEKDEFLKCSERIAKRNDLERVYIKKEWEWGTTGSGFIDPSGNSWSIEINSGALK